VESSYYASSSARTDSSGIAQFYDKPLGAYDMIVTAAGREKFVGECEIMPSAGAPFTDVTLKNLPAKMVSKVRAYDRQSDYSRVTGIDDGEEETVLDLTVKKGMTEGWNINLDLGYGTEDRFAEKLNLSRFTDNLNFSLIGSWNNVGDRGFGGWGRGGNGITTIFNPGMSIAWKNGKEQNEAGRLEIGGNVRYRFEKNDVQTRTNSESFLTSTASQFVNSASQSLSKRKSVNSDFRFEWQPDSMTNIIFRPNFTYSHNRGRGHASSGSYREDPNDTILYRLVDIVVNTNNSRNMNENTSTSMNGELQANRRLSSNGRNLTLRVSGNYSDGKSKQLSAAQITYNTQGTDQRNNRYYDTPTKNYGIQGDRESAA
jgi:hypothetical protein